MSNLPPIPAEAWAAAARAEPATTDARLAAAWPHLYAAALRHAADEMSTTDDVGGPEDNGYAAALRDLRILADDAASPTG